VIVSHGPRHPSRIDTPAAAAFDITVPEDELEGIETVEQAFKLVTGKLG
jgi:hypothetical protein